MSNGKAPSQYDPHFEPLALAIGHLVLAAAMLEKALLALVVQGRAHREGAEEVFRAKMVWELERRSAGVLLEELRKLDLEEDLATEVAAAIAGRNSFVHRLFDDPEFLEAMALRRSVDPLVRRVEKATQDIYRVLSKLEPRMISGGEELFGLSAAEQLALLKEVDPEEIGEGELRRQITVLQQFPDDFVGP